MCKADLIKDSNFDPAVKAELPEVAYAEDGPVYYPVFYYYHTDHLGSSSVMTDSDGILNFKDFSQFADNW